MFGAASNGGGDTRVTYPAKYHEVICIFSTDGKGNPSSYNPTLRGHSSYNFATLGDGVNSAWPNALLGRPKGSLGCPGRRLASSSISAAIAAGIAACVLDFAVVNDMPDDLYKKLRRRQGMEAVFGRLMSDERGGLHYIHPWKLFSEGRTKDTILTLMGDALVS
jgi:hypothetical protein